MALEKYREPGLEEKSQPTTGPLMQNRVELELHRFAYTPEGTYGTIFLPLHGRTIFTVERGWYDNKIFVSCIPDGVYEIVPGYFNRGGYPVPEFSLVPNRTRIKIHKANYPHQVQGCIAPNIWFDQTVWPWRGVNSREALALLMEEVADESLWTLKIGPRGARL